MSAAFALLELLLVVVCHASMVVAVSAASSASSSSAAVVRLSRTQSVRGVVHGEVEAYLGIPFARPPVGDLRWKSPVTSSSSSSSPSSFNGGGGGDGAAAGHGLWTGELDASAYGDSCVQAPPRHAANNESEDCLYLNVWRATPPGSGAHMEAHKHKAALKPVMFWIYGGCWDFGSTDLAQTEGTFIAEKFGSDVVVVSANYRLGPFGFLGSRELLAEAPQNGTGNFGLLDQRAALAWVQQNIEKFGGDPDNVFIWGESAGAGSTSCHMVMPQSWPYFSRAGMESGPLAAWIASPMEQAQQQFDAITKATNCDGASQPADCLRQLSTEEVVAQWATGGRKYAASQCKWNPTIDGVQIPDDPRKLAHAGKFHRGAQVLLGSNADEGSVFILKYRTEVTTKAAYHFFVREKFPEPGFAEQILKLYPGKEGAYWESLVQILTDSAFSCPARRTARWFTNVSDSQPVFLYFWTHVTSGVPPYLGAYHGTELPYVFNDPKGTYKWLDFNPTQDELHLQDAAVTFWTRFGMTGTPNSAGGVHANKHEAAAKQGLLEWPVYARDTDKNIEMNWPLATQANLKQQRCDMWDQWDIPA